MLTDMMVTIGYFAESSGPDVQPQNLTIANGDFDTFDEAVAHARVTADHLQAHSFIIDMPDGTTEREVRDGKGWKRDA
jgi:hypothetical protein